MMPTTELFRIHEIDLIKDVDFHIHTEPEIVLILNGHCEIEIKELDWKKEGRPGDVFILPANIPHNQKNIKPTKTLFWIFNTKKISLTKPIMISFVSNASRKNLVKKWALDLYHLDKSGASDSLQNGLLDTILEVLKEEISPEKSYSPPISKCVANLQENFLDNISIEQLAKISHLSESHLLSRFKNEVGVSPIQFQINLKLRKAKDLLMDPYLSVKEIGMQCGFEDINYFGRLFKKHLQISPGDWRKSFLTKN
jgi:AraC-like DNA-binding protein